MACSLMSLETFKHARGWHSAVWSLGYMHVLV